MADKVVVEYENPRQIDAELLPVLDFKLRHNIPLTTGEYAALVGADPSTIARKRVTGEDAPPFVRIGRKVRYVPSVVLRWLTDRPLLTSTSDAA